METVIHDSVGPGNELKGGEMFKRRKLPIDASDHTYGCTEEYAPNDSDKDGTELGHNDDITGSKGRSGIDIHPVTSTLVHMKSESGGAPYVCKDYDYKNTVNYMFLDHINLHHPCSDSDGSE